MFFSLIIMSWSWLDIGVKVNNLKENIHYNSALLKGKIDIAPYEEGLDK